MYSQYLPNATPSFPLVGCIMRAVACRNLYYIILLDQLILSNFQALPQHSTCNHSLNVLMATKKLDIHTGALEFAQKEAVIKYYEAHPDANYKDVAKWAQKKFNLEKAPHKPTISRILKNQASFLNYLFKIV